ncbi:MULTISPECIES: hypothetical protein [Tenacibaculum]|nr:MULTISPECIES: hypothetical protein [Tenacibaculum]MCO7186449.1 hypothetical protein [Tenacibaculum sp. XPcli2-G]QFS27802.1 hypothetical protein F9Y86_05145 [Tenacibaculum mesophilum]
MMKSIFILSLLFLTQCTTNVNKKEDKGNANKEEVKKSGNKSFAYKVKFIENKIFENNCDKDIVEEQNTIKNIEYYIQLNTDSLNVLSPDEDRLLYKTTIEKINSSTKKYQPSYYYFLLENKDEDIKRTFFSENYLYERVKSNYKEIDFFILLNKIFDETIEGDISPIGYNLELLTYNNIQNKLIDRVRLITSGIGLEDVSYHECFTIDSNNIIVYSYNSMEDESIFIRREIMLKEDGMFHENKAKVEVSN